MELTCKLTTRELQLRKKTVIAALQGRVLKKKEIPNGVNLGFDGSDETIDLLTGFIKTERLCCDFLEFELAVGKADDGAWLKLSGPEGARMFIASELGF